MKKLLLFVIIAASGFAQDHVLRNIVPNKYFGTSAPGSVAGNLAGDLYFDYSAHNAYKCGASIVTAAPACTSVTTGGWEAFGSGGGAGFVYVGTNAGKPGTCTVGQIAFITDNPTGLNPPGQNIDECAVTNTWTPQLNTGGGALLFSQLLDFGVLNTSGVVQQIGGSCSTSLPCIARQLASFFVLSAPATATISGTSDNGTVYWYISSTQVLTAGHNALSTLTCSNCTVATGVTAFPPDSTPLWKTTFTANAWDAIIPLTMNKRASMSNTVISAGTGVSSAYDPTTGIQTFSTDPLTVPRYFTSAGSPVGVLLGCVAGRDYDTDTSNHHFYGCGSAGVWNQLDAGGSSRTDVTDVAFGGANNGTPQAPIVFSSGLTGQSSNTLTGPNSISYSLENTYFLVNGSAMITKKASPTWSAAAGTVDLGIYAGNLDGVPAAGSWVLNFYVGCAGVASGTFTFGSVSTITVTPPNAIGVFSSYTTTSLNLPGSCAANSPMQFWIQRTADTGGTTGVTPRIASMQIIIRGN